MKFTIISPTYNSFHLMKRYFDSLENQSFKDFEVIIIDDCSTDDTFKSLIKYKDTSNLNIVLHKMEINSGPGLSRNIGIDKAKGEYILFIDSDDYIDGNCLKEINDALVETGAECIIFDYYKQKDGNNRYGSSIPRFQNGLVDLHAAFGNSTGSVCCKVYRTKNIKNDGIVFPNLLRFEDMVFNKRALANCKSIYYIKKPLYYYVTNESSIVNDKKNASEKYAIKAFEILESELKDKFPNEIETIFARELLYSTVITMVSNKVRSKDLRLHIKSFESKYPNWFKNSQIRYFSLHQKLALHFIKYRSIFSLRLMVYLRGLLK